MYEITENGIVNEAGQIAVRWNVLTEKIVVIHGTEYLFKIKSNISMVWVNPGDVEAILSVRSTCCGGKAQACHLANELDVKRWLGLSIW